jgi:hypothetical protein
MKIEEIDEQDLRNPYTNINVKMTDAVNRIVNSDVIHPTDSTLLIQKDYSHFLNHTDISFNGTVQELIGNSLYLRNVFENLTYFLESRHVRFAYDKIEMLIPEFIFLYNHRNISDNAKFEIIICTALH